MFDYGLTKNVFKYGSMFPPKYDLASITAPVYLHYSDNDWMAAVKVIGNFFIQLNLIKFYFCNYF